MDRGAWQGYSPWGHQESDTTERLTLFTFSFKHEHCKTPLTHLVTHLPIDAPIVKRAFSRAEKHMQTPRPSKAEMNSGIAISTIVKLPAPSPKEGVLIKHSQHSAGGEQPTRTAAGASVTCLSLPRYARLLRFFLILQHEDRPARLIPLKVIKTELYGICKTKICHCGPACLP